MDSFFLHSYPPSVPPDNKLKLLVLSLTSLDLFRSGYTKLSALRLVRQLCIIFPEPTKAPLPLSVDDLEDPHTPKFISVYDPILDEQLKSAGESMGNMPMGVFPILDVWRMGNIEQYDGEKREEPKDLIGDRDIAHEFALWLEYHTCMTTLSCRHQSRLIPYM